jgi:hypothetical protein
MIQNASWSPGDDLPPGWDLVNETPTPEVGQDQVLEESYPELVDGSYKQTWVVREKTEAELEIDDAPRRAREKLRLLGLTDVEITALAAGLK